MIRYYPPHLNREKWQKLSDTRWRKKSGWCEAILEMEV